MFVRHLLPSLTTVVALPLCAIAATYQVDEGFLVITPPFYASFDLIGANLHVSGLSDGAGMSAVAMCPCPLGSLFPLSSIVGGSLTGQLGGVGSVNSQSYEYLFIGGELRFESRRVPGPLTSGQISAPFTFTGQVQLIDLTSPASGQCIDCDAALIGSGTVTATISVNIVEGHYSVSELRYEFQAVPEPASAILIVSGLVICVLARGRRAHNKSARN